MTHEPHPIETIHHINPVFNRRFSNLLYYCGALVTVLLLVFPYSLRIALAFFVNIFFNRPRVYADYLRMVGNRMSVLPMLVLYVAAIGIYAIISQLMHAVQRKNMATTRWVPIGSETTPSWYDHQS